MSVTEHVAGRILTIDNVLSVAECEELIMQAEDKGFKPSAPSGGGHGQHPNTGSRTSQFCVQEDEKLAQKLWKRVRDSVPKSLRNIKYVPYMNSQTHGDEFTPVGVSPHMRYYKYDPGQHVLKLKCLLMFPQFPMVFKFHITVWTTFHFIIFTTS